MKVAKPPNGYQTLNAAVRWAKVKKKGKGRQFVYRIVANKTLMRFSLLTRAANRTATAAAG